jgi:peptidoglycan/xylan/chitin deacetylase (PgdA/CDA1 family)
VFQALRQFNLVSPIGPRILGWQRSIAFHRAAIAEAGGFRAVEEEFGRSVRVLMYHHVGPKVPGTFPELTVSPKEFEDHLEFLRKWGFNIISSADWIAYVQEGQSLPAKPVLLTFDDAYSDLAKYVFPVLKRLGCSALVFVPTAYVGGTNGWDQLNGSAPHQILSAKEILEWAKAGMEFGAHTRTHPYLEQLTQEALVEELQGSKKDLESVIQKPVTSFAYPYGEYRDREVEHASQYFPMCFTTDEGRNNITTDLGRLRRIMIYPDGMIMFATSLMLGLQPIRWLRDHVRLRTRLRQLRGQLSGNSTANPAQKFE